jgi:ClpA/ClpB-like protein
MAPVRFTKDVRASVLALAGKEARSSGRDAVEAEHLLLALAAHPDLRDFGLDRQRLAAALADEEEQSLAVVGISAAEFDLSATPRASHKARLATSSKLALHRAVKLAVSRGHRRVSAHHLLAGVFTAERGRVPRALEIAGIDIDHLRTKL